MTWEFMTLDFWFMLPISVVFATTAMASGVEGATFFTPLFILALGLPPEIAISTVFLQVRNVCFRPKSDVQAEPPL